MKKMVIGCLIVMILCGCGGNREEALKKAQEKVSSVENQIQISEEKKRVEAAGMVYAAELALERADACKPVEIARGFNDRAQMLLGIPEPAEALQLRQMVNDLLSQIAQEKVRGLERMEELDAKIVKLSAEKEKLKKELFFAERKLSVVSQENAVLANREASREANWWNPFDDLFHSLKKFFIWGVLLFVLVLTLPVLAAFFPAMLPVLNAIGGVLGKILGWFVKIIPGAISGAGLMGKKVFELVSETRNRLVEAIETWQQEQKATGKTDYKELAKHLASVLDFDHKVEINQTKQNLGFV